MKSAQKGISSVGNAMKSAGKVAAVGAVALGSAAIGAAKVMGDLAKQSAAYADDILTMSTVTGMSTESLQAYKYAAQLVDVELETVTKTMAKQIKSMDSARNGTKTVVAAYQKLGVSIKNADGSLRDGEETYWAVIDAMGKMAPGAERDAISMQIFGKSAQELNPLIAQGSQGIKELTEEAKRMGAVLSDDQLASLGDLDDSIQRLDAMKSALKNTFGVSVVKYVLPLVEKSLPKLQGLVAKIPGYIERAGPVISKVMGFAGKAFNGIRNTGGAAISFIQTKWQQYGPKIIGTVENLRSKAVSAFNWARDTGKAAISNIQAKFVEIRPKAQKFIDVVTEIGGKIKSKLQGAFKAAKPVIEWVFTQGFPKVIGIGGNVLDKVSGIYKFFSNNWPLISPVIYGVVGAFVAYKAISLALAAAEGVKNGVMIISKGITIASTAAQWALNAAMTANPIGIVVVAIGALIAIGVLLYKNWDVIKAKAFELWGNIKAAFGGVADWFGGIWEGVKGGFKAFVNFIIGGLNKIPEALNSLKVNIPDWVPGVGGKTLGFSLPTIPLFAKGVRNFKGGPAVVGEKGAELLNLPRGTDVYSNRETRSILSSPQEFGSGFGDIIVKVTNIIKGPITKEQADDAAANIDKAVEAALAKLKAKRRRKAFTG